mgnify:FL=1
MRVSQLPFLSLLLLAAIPIQAQTPLLGFDAAGAASQRALEQEFDSHLDAGDLDAWLREMSRTPHHVGSARGREVVEYIAEHFREWGYDTEIVEYEVLFPSPRTRELELVSPGQYTAGIFEDSLEEDPSTSNIEDLLPPYNAYSIDGEVEAELVFVNFGTPADYEVLERYGVSVEGKIAISRYGGSWRGIKPKLAAARSSTRVVCSAAR